MCIRDRVHMMGGSILLDSQVDVGSTFSFRIQLRPVKEHKIQEKAPQNKKDFSGIRVLVTEDNPLNMEILQYILEDMGMKVDNAYDGKEAVDKFEASKIGYYDLIIMDIMMPEMCIRDRNKSIDLPVCLADLELEKDDKLEDVLEATMANQEMTHTPYPVTKEMIYQAIHDLEDYKG